MKSNSGAPLEDAVAVVGMACRLPGAENVDRFWEVLAEGRETVGEVPEGRGGLGI
ncbi:beta-ketoacyl synthase N-terminal-like domain-containing protein, partial [Streptomyces sp. AC154]|uniref:beta-ketoacyl synthase N-terminal-like domain-containing protein n=1 Tax=Streptomyces sp. AC154 TaxID=3143184 RepID=UPI003F7D8108